MGSGGVFSLGPSFKRKNFSPNLGRKLRVCLVPVKCFPENTYFPEMLISGKEKCMFGLVKHFTKKEIRFLRKINFGVWFVDHFTENMKCVTNSSTCII